MRQVRSTVELCTGRKDEQRMVASAAYADSMASTVSCARHHWGVAQVGKRTEALKKLDSAMRANAALYLLDTLAEMLAQIPAVDAKLSKNVARWNKQLIAERNRMLPLSDEADRLVHN